MIGKEIDEKIEELLESKDKTSLENYVKENPNHVLHYIETQGLLQRISQLKVEKCVLVLSYLLGKK